MAPVLMTQTYKRLQKSQVVGLQKLKWLIFLCLTNTIYLNGPTVSVIAPFDKVRKLHFTLICAQGDPLEPRQINYGT